MINLLRASWLLIKKENLVLYPSIIASYTLIWAAQLFGLEKKTLQLELKTFSYFLCAWMLNLFIQLLAAEIGHKTFRGISINFTNCLKKTFLKFLPALFWAGLLTGNGAYFSLLAQSNKILGLVLLPITLFLSILSLLYPVVYMINDDSAYKIYSKLLNFTRKKFRAFCQLIILVFFISILPVFFTSGLEMISLRLKTVFSPILIGLFNIWSTYIILLMWETNLSEINIER